jgi:hypothetical protein
MSTRSRALAYSTTADDNSYQRRTYTYKYTSAPFRGSREQQQHVLLKAEPYPGDRAGDWMAWFNGPGSSSGRLRRRRRVIGVTTARDLYHWWYGRWSDFRQLSYVGQ